MPRHAFAPAIVIIASMLSGCATVTADHSVDAFQALGDRAVPPSRPAWGGFDAADAASLLQLCIELNNQDDRNNPKLNSDRQYLAKPEVVGVKAIRQGRRGIFPNG